MIRRAGYLPAYPFRIIDATLVLDLSHGWEILYGDMNRSTRQKAQQASRRGMNIRVGIEADVGIFFDLMSKTCIRQGTKPNPGSVSSLLVLWRTFQAGGHIRLTFAEKDNIPLAGLLCLVFGRRFTLWKKGWDYESGDLHPNEFLHLEAIRWAWENGNEFCDFVALDRGIAEAMLAGKALTRDQKSTRHLFNIKMGAKPRLLPSALVFVANPITRALYRGAGRIPLFARSLKKLSLGLS